MKCQVTIINRLIRHKKTSRFTFGGKIHFALGLLASDIAKDLVLPSIIRLMSISATIFISSEHTFNNNNKVFIYQKIKIHIFC